VYRYSLRIGNLKVQRNGFTTLARVVKRCDDLNRGGRVGPFHTDLDVKVFDRDRRNINEVDVPVQASVESEVAKIRRHAIEIARIVALNRDGNPCWILLSFGRGACTGRREPTHGICDVEDKFVITTCVLSYKGVPYECSRSLPRTFEMQQGASLWIRVLDGNVQAIPSSSSISRCIGIASVISIEAMWH
jgi:hypothetical protein